MGFLSSLSAVVAPALPLLALTSQEYNQRFFSGEDVPDWLSSQFGETIAPEIALTLTYVYSAALIVSDDFGTMTCQMFENIGDDDRARVPYSAPGIGQLARKLRWQPNNWQTAKAFWSTLGWQYVLRPVAYAEIVYRQGLNGFVDQLIPRHPDRVRQELLPSGRVRFKLYEPHGGTRIVTQDEMFVVRNISTDGLTATSRIDYGAGAIQTGLALQHFTRNYFQKGATAALVATYKGTQDEENETDLHASLTRYANGAENAGGILVVPQDIDIKSLGVDPEKSQLEKLKNLTGRDIARLFKMPPSWLGIENAQAYGSNVQDAANYVNRTQVPMVVEFEQAIQRDLVVAQDRYFAKFNMDYLLRASLKERMEAYEIGIRARVIRPSEARSKEELPKDLALDKLSEMDNRPGTPKNQPVQNQAESARRVDRATLATVANAVSCVRRERAVVTKLAVKHASDPDGWKASLQEFYADHAQYVAVKMGMPIGLARAFAAQHGSQFENQGMPLIQGDAGEAWESAESAELAELALSDVEVAA